MRPSVNPSETLGLRQPQPRRQFRLTQAGLDRRHRQSPPPPPPMLSPLSHHVKPPNLRVDATHHDVEQSRRVTVAEVVLDLLRDLVVLITVGKQLRCLLAPTFRSIRPRVRETVTTDNEIEKNERNRFSTNRKGCTPMVKGIPHHTPT